MGWTGKILRIDLTNGTVNTEATNMEWADKYLGQRGSIIDKFLLLPGQNFGDSGRFCFMEIINLLDKLW